MLSSCASNHRLLAWPSFRYFGASAAPVMASQWTAVPIGDRMIVHTNPQRRFLQGTSWHIGSEPQPNGQLKKAA
jgi:hypothetical protein